MHDLLCVLSASPLANALHPLPNILCSVSLSKPTLISLQVSTSEGRQSTSVEQSSGGSRSGPSVYPCTTQFRPLVGDLMRVDVIGDASHEAICKIANPLGCSQYVYAKGTSLVCCSCLLLLCEHVLADMCSFLCVACTTQHAA